jgi:putative ABC transport system permease protein
VSGFYKATPGDAAPIIDDVASIRRIVASNTPNLAYITDRHRGWSKVVSPTGSLQSALSGIDIAQERRFLETLQLAAESDYREGGSDEVLGDPERLADPHTAMLFASQARRLEVGVGDSITLQTETFGGRTNTADVTVVAVAKDVGLLSNFTLYVPKSQIFELYALNDNTSGAVWVYLDDIEDADDTLRHLREVFIAEGYAVMDHEANPFFMKFETVQGEDWTGQKIDITTWKDEVSFLTWVITAFNTVTWFLVTILVVIVAIGIMNTMWNAVRERTREVGTMRAIGMSRRRVLSMFLLEAVMLGLSATTIGALLGAATAIAIDAARFEVPVDAMKMILLSETVRMSVSASSLVSAVAFLTTCTALSALWPALRASLLRPVTAIGHAE